MARRDDRGAVLIIVLGVLIVLCLLGVTFAEVSTLNRSISRNYLDQVRAALVARSGVEAAASRLAAAAERGVFEDPDLAYWGDDLAETGPGGDPLPLEEAGNPSFALTGRQGTPVSYTIDGVEVGISAHLGSGTYAPNGDLYRLRVADANSMIHVNDGLDDPTGRLVLTRLLNVLGDLVGVQGAGERIVGARPAGGYHSKRELERVLGSRDFQRIRPFVTATAWVDRDLVHPVPLSPEMMGLYPVAYNAAIGGHRYGRSRSAEGKPIGRPLLLAPERAEPRGADHAIVALDEINAQWIQRAARAPVNVNLASREVLTALITGLRGWFVSGRRKTNPDLGLYSFRFHKRYDNIPGGSLGDEIGFLYTTLPFSGAGSGTTTGAEGIPAAFVADEIVACRRGRPSPHCPTLDYGRLWYGGPFRTWRQFHAFCDGLVAGGLLRDDRPIFFDYEASAYATVDGESGSAKKGDGATGPSDLQPSEMQAAYASQALADVLKANFNPNCTLNELNPDANLFLAVDKTDLICASTEFCLTSMGIFEIESDGLILHTEGDADLAVTRTGRSIARSRAVAVVRVFDARRETTQADLAAGDAGLRPGHRPVTNNNRTLEAGPEPDNGPAPLECRWSGWLQLPTIGGHWTRTGQTHLRGTSDATPAGEAERGSTLHTHFTLDHALHHHENADRAAILFNDQNRNNPDRTEEVPGPYGPAGGRHRLARDWACPAQSRAYDPVAPGDLRIDGAYIERDSAVMWGLTKEVFSTVGTVAMWFKPSFHPEMTGKPRILFGMDTSLVGGESNANAPVVQRINGLWFFASHEDQARHSSTREHSNPVYQEGPWRPASLVCGYSAGAGGIGKTSPSLNHRGHADSQRADLLRHHGWVHVAYHWDMDRMECRLWINGAAQPGTSDIRVHPKPTPLQDFRPGTNTIRLGETSKTWEIENMVTRKGVRRGTSTRNWSGDGTVDEFYLWKGDKLEASQDLFALGRYLAPLPGYDASFSSREFRLGSASRSLAPPSANVRVPVASREAVRVSPTAALPQAAVERPTVRILGAAWTWHPESTDAEGRPVTRDHHADLDLLTAIKVRFMVNGTGGPAAMEDDRGSAAGAIPVGPEDRIRTQLFVGMPQATVDTILLATPVIDDVTLYFSAGVEYLGFEIELSAA